jgi:hypothetical protein
MILGIRRLIGRNGSIEVWADAAQQNDYEIQMTDKLPGKGFLGWLGRQVGHVTGAVKKDVTKSIVHREQKIEEVKLPERPDVTLRRTVIDEVIVQKKKEGADSNS